MYVQTPKRPVLPTTPSTYGKRTSLPPLASILSVPKNAFSRSKLPSIDTFNIETSLPTPANNNNNNFLSPLIGRTAVLGTPLKPTEQSNIVNTQRDIKNPSPRTARRASGENLSKDYAFISHSPATFPTQEPSIDNAPLARRKRRRTSPNELAILNKEFELGSTPNKSRRLEISNKLSMTEKAVQIWFQNKRQSLRKQSNSEKEVTELPPTPPVSTSHLISSTPTKPALSKSHSFMTSPSITASSPIKHRSNSIPNLNKFQQPFVTPVTNKTTMFKNMSTPNSSFIPEDINSSFDAANSSTLVLSETKKKQPESLNSNVTSTMTFKLAPSLTSTSRFENKLQNADKENLDTKSKMSNILNSSTPSKKRMPLSEINTNKRESCVENLLSLKSGNWN